MPELQQVILLVLTGVFGVIQGLMILILKTIWSELKRAEAESAEIRQRLTNHEIHVPQFYLSKASFDKAQQNLDDRLKEIKTLIMSQGK